MPRSLYGISKLAGYHLSKNYREAYGMFVCNGIPFNHESPRRGFEFATRKISSHVAKIKLGITDKLPLGNIKAKRDWEHAKEYVKAMWIMLQQDYPGDYVIATGETHSVEEFAKIAFEHIGLNYKDYVESDKKYFRPSEVKQLVGDSTKARESLGWECGCKFKDLVKEMVDNDLAFFQKDKYRGYVW